MMRNLDDYRVAAADFETDPFRPGRLPEPFAGGFYYPGDPPSRKKRKDYVPEIWIETWGPNCAQELADQLAKLDVHFLIYVHNGGRFDFHFMYDLIEPPVTLINQGRLAEFCLGGRLKRRPRHVVRDSLCIVPVPLEDYHKETIDYRMFEAWRRDVPANKAKIVSYMKSDCVSLQSLCSAFVKRFGKRLTIGSAAMAELLKTKKMKRRFSEGLDEEFRPYYFGGRTQMFERGIVEGPWQMIDINSCFAAAMRNFKHPWGCEFDTRENVKRLPKGFYFAEITARNRNALPVHRVVMNKKSAQVVADFGRERDRFYTTSHELELALDYGMVDLEEIHAVHVPLKTTNFARFVDRFYSEKRGAKIAGDKAAEIFAKTMLVTPYGKFGQDPRRFRDYAILRDPFLDWRMRKDGYELENHLRDDLEIWSKPSGLHRNSFYDVSVAASITSASRAMLLSGMRQAIDLIYCDTDSMICAGFKGEIDPLKLGAWKIEAQAEFAAIVAPKTYCLYNHKIEHQGHTYRKVIEPVKWASAGESLSPFDIIKLAKGERVEVKSIKPVFSWYRGMYFPKRQRFIRLDDIAPF